MRALAHMQCCGRGARVRRALLPRKQQAAPPGVVAAAAAIANPIATTPRPPSDSSTPASPRPGTKTYPVAGHTVEVSGATVPPTPRRCSTSSPERSRLSAGFSSGSQSSRGNDDVSIVVPNPLASQQPSSGSEGAPSASLFDDASAALLLEPKVLITASKLTSALLRRSTESLHFMSNNGLFLSAVVALLFALIPILSHGVRGTTAILFAPWPRAIIALRFVVALWSMFVLMQLFRLALVDIRRRSSTLRRLGKLLLRRFEEVKCGGPDGQSLLRLKEPMLSMYDRDNVGGIVVVRRMLIKFGLRYAMWLQTVTSMAFLVSAVLSAAVIAKLAVSYYALNTITDVSDLAVSSLITQLLALLVTLFIILFFLIRYATRANNEAVEVCAVLSSRQMEARRATALCDSLQDSEGAQYWRSLDLVLGMASQTVSNDRTLEPFSVLGFAASDALLHSFLTGALSVLTALFTLLTPVLRVSQ
jgi:hypothetical protein